MQVPAGRTRTDRGGGQPAQRAARALSLRRQLDAAATVIATLHHENGALRAQLNRDAIVISIDKPHHRADHRPVS
jgi:predicted HD phosphohydrolase